MEFHEKTAFLAVTGVFVVVCVGFAAAGLGVDYSAHKAIDWVGAVGSGLGGLGAAGAAGIALYSTRRSEAAALSSAQSEVLREAQSLSVVIAERREIIGNVSKEHLAGKREGQLFQELKNDLEAYDHINVTCVMVYRNCRAAKDIQELSQLQSMLIHVRAQISRIDEIAQNRLDNAHRRGLLPERYKIPVWQA